MKRLVLPIALAIVSTSGWGQQLTPRPATPAPPESTHAPTVTLPLTVPAGTPLKVALDKEVRIREAGQPIYGRLVEPVYAFDKLVLPAGTGVTGKIASIAPISKKMRVLSVMNADLSPDRKIQAEFDSLRLPDGRQVALHADTAAAPLGVLQFVPAARSKSGATRSKSFAIKKVIEAKHQPHQEWDFAKQQLHAPDKIHRAERYVIAQLPYHPQYLDAGTTFDADLTQPLSFGSETITTAALASIGSAPPAGSVVHAVLATALSSATARKGDAVEAVLTQPLTEDGRLYAPEGSRLKGTVLQAKPARRFSRNGQLRIVFHQLVPPNGVEQALAATLEAVAVAKDEHLALDSEGGAQVMAPKSRYLTTAVALALATASASPDRDREMHGNSGDAGGQAASGASGYRAVGMILGAVSHSRVISTGLGVYGAGLSVYSHFLARGRDVVYPKDMSILVSLGSPQAPAK